MQFSFFRPLAQYVPEPYQTEFLEEVIDSNFKRALFISKLSIYILLLISLPDIYNIVYSNGSSFYNYLGLFTNIALLTSLILWKLALNIKLPNINSNSKLLLVKLFLFPLITIISIHAYILNNEFKDISSYYIALYGNIMFFYLPGYSQILTNLISFSVILLMFVFTDKDYVSANNTTQMMAISFLLCILYWRMNRLNKAEEFLNKKRYYKEKENTDRLNSELIEKNKKLEELNIEKSEFLGIAAHDLKNPLMSIKMASEMICIESKDCDDSIINELGNDINKVSQNMFEIINNYLDVNKIESVGIKVNAIGLCIYELLQVIVTRFEEQIKSKNIEVKFINFSSPIFIYSDIYLLKQIFDNLVSNAIKYSPMDSEVNIILKESNNDIILIAIKDNGEGISKEEKKHLFQKFKKLSSVPTAGEHSTGLGLYIAKKITDRLQGKIWCESEKNKGCEFLVELPKRIAN